MASEKLLDEDDLLDLDELIALVMCDTGKSRREVRAMAVQAIRAGELQAYFVPPGEDEAVRIPPDAFPVEH